MKQIVIAIALTAFGMSAEAQINRDSLAKDSWFQNKVITAAFKVSNQVLDTSDKVSPYYKYATFIRKEPTNRYWIDQLSFGVVYDYPQTDGNCPQDTITHRLSAIFNRYAEISGL